MNPQSTPTAVSSSIDDLFTLTLADGLPVEAGGKVLRYRTVKLRETTIADERIAARMAERVVTLNGAPKLLVSDSDFRYALTLRHCDQFLCDGQVLHQAVLDLDVFGKLSPHDLQLIEERVVFITLAAQVRYGTLTLQEFEDFAAGRQPAGVAPASPQPMGQAPGVEQNAGHAESGPALLADFTGDVSQGAGRGARL
jgi:phage FluMu protein gp41